MSNVVIFRKVHHWAPVEFAQCEDGNTFEPWVAIYGKIKYLNRKYCTSMIDILL